jgi:hypothetical protein
MEQSALVDAANVNMLGRNINTIKNKGGTEEHHQKLNKDSQSFG